MDKPHILVADDEADIADSLVFTLEQEGYQLSVARDGHEALDRARELDPDLIVLDVMMPKENGYRVAKALYDDFAQGRRAKKIKIILLTARDLGGDPEREDMFMNFSQADQMVYKPFDMDELLERIRFLLEA